MNALPLLQGGIVSEPSIWSMVVYSDWFTKNLIAIRAEKRLTLCVYRPASFITGSFTTSPA